MLSEQDWAQQFGTIIVLVGMLVFAIGVLILRVAQIDGRVSDHAIGWGGVMALGIYLCYKGLTLG